jgi:hypothetical protein
LAGLLALIALAVCLPALPCQAQVLVYKMSFKPLRQFNIDFYDSGYFVAPAKGGSGSFIFTIKDKSPRVYNATGSGEFFTAKRANGQAYMAVRADVGATNSGASASYLAWGSAWRVATLTGPTFTSRLKIATSIKGSAIASSDEKEEAESRDKDIGFASTFDWRLMWDEDATSDANAKGLTVAETITALTDKIESQGFEPEVTSADNSSGSGGTPSTPGVSISP